MTRRLRTAGVDEAGRGPLAGPVVVAAVILHPRRPIDGLDDSKKLTEKRREALYPQIVEQALAWRIEFVGVEEIDRINLPGDADRHASRGRRTGAGRRERSDRRQPPAARPALPGPGDRRR